MRIQRQEVLEMVYAVYEEIRREENNKDDSFENLELVENTVLYGKRARLKSITLVTLIIDIEQRLADEFGVEVILADEKALSQKRSPFRDIGSLVDYICSLEV